MRLTFLGVSSALSCGYKNFHSNMLIESHNSRRMLIDCGGDVRHALAELKYTASSIDDVYISHLHADHVGGLEWLGLSKYFGDKILAGLYLSPELQQPLWNNVLCGGMSTLAECQAELNTFFQVHPIANLEFKWQDCRFKLIKVIHTYSNHKLLPSYGLLIYGPQQTALITTDSRHTPELLAEAYSSADIIFQDCETLTTASNQHAHYHELCSLDAAIKEKMWLYDYNHGPLPNSHANGFAGFVKRGQIFNL